MKFKTKLGLASIAAAFLFQACQSDSNKTMTDPAGRTLAPPERVVSRYDSLNGIVRLSWKKSTSTDVYGYAIYRSRTGATIPELRAETPVLDTFFLDTIYSSSADTAVYSFEYRVRSMNSNLDQGVFSKPTQVPAVPPSWVRTFLRLTRSRDEATLNDTVTFRIEYDNRTRRNDSLIARIGSEIRLAKRLTGTSGEESFDFISESLGSFEAVVSIRDEGGSLWTDSIGIAVFEDPPTAEAQGDRFVFGGDSIHLHGIGKDRGRIVKWEWRLGDSGSWHTVSKGDTTVVAPIPAEHREPEYYVLRVTDEDGHSALDSIPIKIYFTGERWIRDPRPLPSWAVNPFGYGGTTQCAQMNGRIWLIRSLQVYDRAFPVHVWSSANGSDWDAVTADAGLPARGYFSSASWNGKLWIIGGLYHGSQRYHDVWSSPDGKSWTKEADSTAMGSDLQYGYAFVAQGQLWYVKESKAIFHSSDGIKWELAGYVPLEGDEITGAVEFAGKIWLFGNETAFTSPDGKTWTPSPMRFGVGAPSPVVFRDKIYVVLPISGATNTFYTADGIAWKSFRSNTLDNGGHCLESFQDRLFAFGGSFENIAPNPRILYTK